MFLLRAFAPWLLLAFLGQQASLSYGARNKHRGADPTGLTSSLGRAQRSGKSAATGRGKFSIDNEEMQCTWAAKDVGGDTVKLTVKCENQEARIKGGVTDMDCEYNGKPQLCPGYQSNPKGYWKQVARVFKRLQDRVCKDEQALVRAVMCKRAPREANFKLDVGSSSMSAQSGEPEIAKPSACRGKAERLKKAEHHCGGWASVCSFFFSMVQSEDC